MRPATPATAAPATASERRRPRCIRSIAVTRASSSCSACASSSSPGAASAEIETPVATHRSPSLAWSAVTVRAQVSSDCSSDTDRRGEGA